MTDFYFQCQLYTRRAGNVGPLSLCNGSSGNDRAMRSSVTVTHRLGAYDKREQLERVICDDEDCRRSIVDGILQWFGHKIKQNKTVKDVFPPGSRFADTLEQSRHRTNLH